MKTKTKPMPADAHLRAPQKTGVHLVHECDEVLARHPDPRVADAWLDERLLAMDADVRFRDHASPSCSSSRPS